MILSEKASAFFIENLISKVDKKSNTNKKENPFTACEQYLICSSSSSTNSSFSLNDFTKANDSPIPNHDCVSPISSCFTRNRCIKYFTLLILNYF